MNANEYAEKVVRDFIKDITDHLFLSIERDDDAMKNYMTNVNRSGVQEVNMAIGSAIKELLRLENDGQEDQPKSSLIKSYTRHKLPNR